MLRFYTAGESHGESLVAFISGLPAGLKVDIEFVNRELWRRQQGYGRGGRIFETTWGGALSVSNTAFTPAYTTGTAWNFATGLGSVDVNLLVTNWKN